MLKLGRDTKVKVLFIVLVFVFNLSLFISAAILEKGLLCLETAGFDFQPFCEPAFLVPHRTPKTKRRPPRVFVGSPWDMESHNFLTWFFIIILCGFFILCCSYYIMLCGFFIMCCSRFIAFCVFFMMSCNAVLT